MTETTPRIRWIDSPETSTTAFIGWAGSIHESQFAIYKPDQDEGDYILVSQLSGLDEKRYYDADPEALKAEAERWLAGFVSSLGAVFPDEPGRPSRAWHADWAKVDRDRGGNAILRHKPTGGLYKILPVEEC